MNRDRYWHTRGARTGVLLALLQCIAGPAGFGLLGWFFGGDGLVIGMGAGYVVALLALAGLWISGTNDLARLAPEVRASFDTPPPQIIAGNGEGGPR